MHASSRNPVTVGLLLVPFVEVGGGEGEFCRRKDERGFSMILI